MVISRPASISLVDTRLRFSLITSFHTFSCITNTPLPFAVDITISAIHYYYFRFIIASCISHFSPRVYFTLLSCLQKPLLAPLLATMLLLTPYAYHCYAIRHYMPHISLSHATHYATLRWLRHYWSISFIDIFITATPLLQRYHCDSLKLRLLRQTLALTYHTIVDIAAIVIDTPAIDIAAILSSSLIISFAIAFYIAIITPLLFQIITDSAAFHAIVIASRTVTALDAINIIDYSHMPHYYVIAFHYYAEVSLSLPHTHTSSPWHYARCHYHTPLHARYHIITLLLPPRHWWLRYHWLVVGFS